MRIMGFKRLSQTIGIESATILSQYLGLSSQSDDIDILIEELNKQYFFCVEDHSYYRYYLRDDNSFSLTEVGMDGFRARYMSRVYLYNSIRRGKVSSMNPADIFFEHPNRLTVEKVIFDPEKPMGFFLENGITYFNQWNGWPFEAKKGNWEKLHDFLLNGAFDGNQENYEWFIKWLAFKIQNPHRLPEIAVIFYGINLVGKSFLCEFILPNLFGMNRSLPSTDINSFSKDFNSKFFDKFFIHICESNLSKIDRKNIGNILKRMISSTEIEIELKGKDVFLARNYCTFAFTTNEFHGVPIEKDLRRFAAFEFGTAYLNRHDLFGEIEDEYMQGGAEAFLYHLLNEVQVSAEEAKTNINVAHNEEESEVNEKEQKRSRNNRIKSQLKELVKSAPKTEVLIEIEAASEDMFKKCWRMFIETGYVNNGKIVVNPNDQIYISTNDFYQGCKDRIHNFSYDERGFCLRLGRELVEMCGKEWTEPTRKKINAGLGDRLGYTLRGSYAYVFSRQELSDRHMAFRNRRIKPKPMEESDEILREIISDSTVLATKLI